MLDFQDIVHVKPNLNDIYISVACQQQTPSLMTVVKG